MSNRLEKGVNNMSNIKKRDLKALTVLGIKSAVDVSNENNGNKSNKVIFITSFGYVVSEKILFKDMELDELNNDNIGPFMISNAAKNARDMLKENGNEDVLNDQTSFVLENVQIKPFNGDLPSNLPSMILFSDQIVGLSLGSFSEIQ